ncbi:hypothetical protein DACRYDRAFT_16414 [Dacryopinax primogenitus]|uniref:Uncharacterized protein n=1 Tax=Dacryopinax primogenitus (strain DJM 731) TaxID=1858805 RepID=M5FX91_DACPD|nr:uncharacterized protein DACRYDRAFT_16414 [Dacryopinax primogenitus]EJU01059.1 hypothetical protein DACRYDRAFT_16414 [Dacryopinax primogenitus]
MAMTLALEEVVTQPFPPPPPVKPVEEDMHNKTIHTQPGILKGNGTTLYNSESPPKTHQDFAGLNHMLGELLESSDNHSINLILEDLNNKIIALDADQSDHELACFEATEGEHGLLRRDTGEAWAEDMSMKMGDLIHIDAMHDTMMDCIVDPPLAESHTDLPSAMPDMDAYIDIPNPVVQYEELHVHPAVQAFALLPTYLHAIFHLPHTGCNILSIVPLLCSPI